MKIVLLKWIDSTLYNFWEDIEGAKERGCSVAYACGILAGETETEYLVATNLNEDKSCMGGWVAIPKGCVTDFEVVKKVDWG